MSRLLSKTIHNFAQCNINATNRIQLQQSKVLSKLSPYIRIENPSLFKRFYSNKLVIFDIDGVILRGHTAIKNANLALKELEKNNIPYLFLTNGSPCTEKKRSEQLSTLLGVQIDPDTMFMAQTPFRDLTAEHDKNFLVINQGSVKDIINASGFKNVFTIPDLLERFPTYDACDKEKHLNALPHQDLPKLPKLDGIILMEDPINWETAYQLILDVIITEGRMECGDANDYLKNIVNHKIMPIYVGCTDYFWVTEAPYPRFAHGTFLKGLESLYLKTTNRKLEYTGVYGKPNVDTYKFIEKWIVQKFKDRLPKHLFFVGDNPLTDIYGANVYKQHLVEKKSTLFNIYPMLVRSGVFTGLKIDVNDPACSLNFLHHTTPKNSMYLYPHAIVQDSHEAVNHILKTEY